MMRVGRGFERGERVPGPRRDHQDEVADVLVVDWNAGCRRGRLLVVDQRLGDARRAGAGEDGAEHVEREAIVAALTHRRPLDVEPRHLHAVLVDETLLGRQRHRIDLRAG